MPWVRQSLCPQAAASATYEDIDSFIERHPNFQLRDELLVEGGCHVGKADGRNNWPGKWLI
jgi:hypothetical protein